MAQYYDSDTLIESVKRRINIPENQSTFTAEDLLAFANEELGLSIVPSIMSLHEDYLLFSEDTALEDDVRDYPIPYRAVGNKLYDLQFIDTNGAAYEMTRTTEAEEPNYQTGYVTNRQYAYYVKNNRIILMPNVENAASTGSLRFIYYIRPSELVATSRVAIITSIDTVTGLIVVDGIPDNFDTNILYDLYKSKSPHNILTIDITASNVNSSLNTIQFDPDDLPRYLEVGDHIAQSTECSIPQIPSDLHVYLAQKTAERILESQGDSEGLQQARMKSAEMEMRAGNIIDNRVEESPFKLVNRNGPLRGGLFNRWYNRRG